MSNNTYYIRTVALRMQTCGLTDSNLRTTWVPCSGKGRENAAFYNGNMVGKIDRA